MPGALAGAVVVIATRSIVDIPKALIAIITIFTLNYTKKIPEQVVIAIAALIGIIIKFAGLD